MEPEHCPRGLSRPDSRDMPRTASIIPARMQGLPRDSRGYLVPFVVMIDQGGAAHFALNAEEKKVACRVHDLCGICGQKLLRGRWFTQGPGSALHATGAYIDPPMHGECIAYALRVCPYLAAPKYMRMIAMAQAEAVPDRTFINHTPGQTRPSYFVAVMATGQRLNLFGHYVPRRPYARIQIWQHGVKLLDGGSAVALRLQQAYEAAGAIRPPLDVLLHQMKEGVIKSKRKDARSGCQAGGRPSEWT
jgi:hypothetical protein